MHKLLNSCMSSPDSIGDTFEVSLSHVPHLSLMSDCIVILSLRICHVIMVLYNHIELVSRVFGAIIGERLSLTISELQEDREEVKQFVQHLWFVV